ncbi:MAG TPA: IclR family transcriptional regulator [Nocardioidaceae bacterium]|nr:IclR family transcriptional regulator [Nocardioidaceae bacterium]
MSESRSYLARLLHVLEFVAEHTGAVTLTEVSEGTGVPVSTASRLMGLLTERGYLVRGTSGSYTLGPRLAHLGLRTVAHLRGTQRLEEAARDLSTKTGESVSAGLLVGAEIVLVARQEAAHPLRVVARVGDIIPAHVSAMGKAILAHLPEERRRQMLSAGVGADKATAVLADLRGELEQVLGDGYACDEQTYAVGQRCRAAAVLDHNGEAVGGLSIAGPAARYTPEFADDSVPHLLAATAALGTPGGDNGPVAARIRA